MAYVPNDEKITAMANFVFKNEMTGQLMIIAKRILNNSGTAAIDCAIKNAGDPGFVAFDKTMKFAEQVSANPNTHFNKFCEVFSKSDIVDNSDLFNMLINISDNSNTSTEVADYFMNSTQIFNLLVGIKEKDLN